MSAQSDKLVTDVTRGLLDKGKLIEAGWMSLRVVFLPPNTPPEQLADMRMAFFAGAQHLFGSLMTGLEEGDEPTDNDVSRSRFDKIAAELETFADELTLRLKTEGSA